MAVNNAELALKVQENGGPQTPMALQHSINKWFSQSMSNLASLAGSPSEAKKMFAICLSQVNRNPRLAECTRESLTSCISQTMAFGLLPGAFKECAFVPRRNKQGKWEANWQPQYQGLIKLAYNSGVLANIRAEVVWSADQFSMKKGLVQDLDHVPFTGDIKDRGTRVGVYCVWKTTLSNEPDFIYLDARFVNTTKARAPGAKMGDSPWNSSNPDDVDWMWKKTAVIQALKLLPKSDKMAHALDLDEDASGDKEALPKTLNFHVEEQAALPEDESDPV